MNIRFSFIYLTVFVNVMAFTMIFPLLPSYAQEFNASTTQIGLLAATFGFAQLFCSPLWGRVSDRIGRKPTIMMGISGLAVGFLLLAVASNLTALFIARLIQGMFSGAALPSARAYIADVTDKTQRVKYMGRIGASLALGVMMGPFIGGVLAESGILIPGTPINLPPGVATPFFASLALATLNLILVLLFLPESLSEKAQTVAWKEGFVHFTRMRAFFAGPLAPILVLAFVWSFGVSNNQVSIPLFAELILGEEPGRLGLLFGVMGAVSLLMQLVFLSTITRLLGERRTVTIGLSLVALTIASMPFLPSFSFLVVAAALVSLGSSAARPVITALASEETTEGYGTTMGMMTAMEAFGRMVGPLLGGVLFGLSFYAPFLFSAVVLAAAILTAITRFDFFKRKHRHAIL